MKHWFLSILMAATLLACSSDNQETSSETESSSLQEKAAQVQEAAGELVGDLKEEAQQLATKAEEKAAQVKDALQEMTQTGGAMNDTKNCERYVSLTLKVPDTTWSGRIEKVLGVGDELWVFSHLSQMEGQFCLAVISEVKDEVLVCQDDKTIKHFVTGKTWGWENEEELNFVDAHPDMPADAEILYTKDAE